MTKIDIMLRNYDLVDSYKLKIFDFILEHYDTAEHLKPSLCLDIKTPCFIIENEALDLIGVSFFNRVTDNLVQTYRTVIHKDYRGQGVGTKLNIFMEKEFKKIGCKKVTCNIYSDNIPSLVVKMKQGYLIEGLLRDHDFKDVHEYILGKKL